MTRYAVRYLLWRLDRDNDSKRGHITRQDCRIYYEIHGEGPPLILLHGGLTSVEAWFCQLPTLAARFRVVAVDLRGHGRSTLGSQPFTYRLLAEDVLQVMQALDITTAHIVGWSDGGNVGLIIAVLHPERVQRLVALGANFHPGGLTAEAQNSMQSATPSNHSLITKLLYKCVSPNPGGWETLWYRTTTMWRNYPQLSINDLATIESPTLIIQGENDLVTADHGREMTNAIPNAELAIVPRAGHNLLFTAAEESTALIDKFLSPEMD